MARKLDERTLQGLLMGILVVFAFLHLFLLPSCTMKQVETQEKGYNGKGEIELLERADEARIRRLRELDIVERKVDKDSFTDKKGEEGHYVEKKPTFAGQITFQKEYTYQASEADSKLSCRTIALEQVKRLLLEELGVYIESTFEDRCTREDCVTKNEIITLTAGFVQTEIISEKWDGQTYWLKAKIVADPDEVVKSVEALRKNQLMKDTLERQREESGELLKEVERLKKELASAKGSVQADKIKKYRDTVHKLSANDWFERGSAFQRAGENQSAIESYDKAIELNPEEGVFYLGRSEAYANLGNKDVVNKRYNKGIENCQRALDDCFRVPIDIKNIENTEPFAFIFEMNAYNCLAFAYGEAGKQLEETFYYRMAVISGMFLERYPSLHGYSKLGRAYMGLNQFKKAFNTLNKALQIDPEFAPAAIELAIAYTAYTKYKVGERLSLDTPVRVPPIIRAERLLDDGKYNEVIDACDEAIELDPEDAIAYSHRGMSYRVLKNYQQAFRDLNRSIELAPKIESSYYIRGNIYFSIGNYEQAIKDYDQCIKLNPKVSDKAIIYYQRGRSYTMLENYQKGIMDLNKAIELNPALAKAYRSRSVVYSVLGDHQRSKRDMITAAKLGDRKARDYLKSKGIRY